TCALPILTEAVVNLAGNAGALVFADGLLPGGEAAQRGPGGAQLCLGPLGLGDVAICAERALLPAKLDADKREQSIARLTVPRPELELDIAHYTVFLEPVDNGRALHRIDDAECDGRLAQDLVARPIHQTDERFIRIE